MDWQRFVTRRRKKEQRNEVEDDVKIVCYRCVPAIADALARPRSEERGSATKVGFTAYAGIKTQWCKPCACKAIASVAYLSRHDHGQ